MDYVSPGTYCYKVVGVRASWTSPDSNLAGVRPYKATPHLRHYLVERQHHRGNTVRVGGSVQNAIGSDGTVNFVR